MELIGIIPAAGQATRLPSLPFSKELLPIGYSISDSDGATDYQINYVIDYLLKQLKLAQVKRIYIIISKEKYDILRYLGNGNKFGLNFSFIIQEEKRGMPDAINLVYPWINHSTTLFGMPDTYFFPENSFSLLLSHFYTTKADVSLGLFPTNQPQKYGMVCLDENNNLLYTVDKPESTELKYMWGIACWNTEFSKFMNEFLRTKTVPVEVVLSEVFQAAKEAGLRVNGFPFLSGGYVDIGTPKDLIDGTYLHKSHTAGSKDVLNQ